MNAEFEKNKKENERLRKALDFYSDTSNYEQTESEYFEGYPPEVMSDRGWKARNALGKS